MSTLPVELAHKLAVRPASRRWLIECLWADCSVGIVGGEPKCCKSFLALDMAVSVASGTPCLRRYRVARQGRVLLYAAEDALHVVRSRLEGIARAAGVKLEAIDIQVITASSVRLDQEADRARLAETVAALQPVLLVLDPFVRLHRIDENVSSEVAPLLAYLRELQRAHDVAVAVVHHAKKGAAKAREGQALRGSSEFHAWGDSNLYLRRTGDRLVLSVEQRAAPSVGGIPIALTGGADALALTVVDGPAAELPIAAGPPPAPPAEERVRHALAAAAKPVGLTALRKLCRMRTQNLTQALVTLTAAGRIEKTATGYQLRG
jgi:hypothetical protein